MYCSPSITSVRAQQNSGQGMFQSGCPRLVEPSLLGTVPPNAFVQTACYSNKQVKEKKLNHHLNEVPAVNNPSNKISEFFGNGAESTHLWQYVQSMSPETVAHLSKPDSQEVFQVMERNIIGLLGGLPSEQFDVTITTSREQLGRLLASAMMSGYFLRNAEQRFAFERSLRAENLSEVE